MLTGLLFGQDLLLLKSGESYNGTFIRRLGFSSVVFQVEGENDSTKFPMKDVAMIKTSDGELTYPFKIPTKEKDSSILWAQTDFDTLIMNNGTTYFGEYSKIEREIVYFKPQNTFAFSAISIKQIQSLKLKDGQIIIGEQDWKKNSSHLLCNNGCLFFINFNRRGNNYNFIWWRWRRILDWGYSTHTIIKPRSSGVFCL